jgi:hypothetical protein
VLDEILKWHIEGQHLSSKEYAHAAAFVAKLRTQAGGPEPLPACKSWCSAANTSAARLRPCSEYAHGLWHGPADADCGTLRIAMPGICLRQVAKPWHLVARPAAFSNADFVPGLVKRLKM